MENKGLRVGLLVALSRSDNECDIRLSYINEQWDREWHYVRVAELIVDHEILTRNQHKGTAIHIALG